MPAARAAWIVEVSTCDTYPTIGTDASAGSDLIVPIVSIGLVRGLFRSTITSSGVAVRICSSALAAERANATVTPACVAAPRIFEVNSRSSRIARITW